ncbi:hypothetical protein NB688_004184 [Xanthomonas sacchari]|uniref:Transcriptional regulator n=1 Tax=Xanthomonas sacchari TaxID=56458 RepID=A0ABT3DWJ2_9XANT|nr:hypothetical protein [Xanthomonas sacchari]MCW0399885.1 hypothetical protein [Xanthomonas sacchari]MCW0422018.1 hypothetical protein [Xanthomonas sacchari]
MKQKPVTLPKSKNSFMQLLLRLVAERGVPLTTGHLA